MATDNAWAEVKARLDVLTSAAQLSLNPKGNKFDCPACGGKHKAMSKDGMGWYCVKCEEKGDSIDLFRICLSISPRAALKQAAYSIGVDVDAPAADGDRPPLPDRVKPEPWSLHHIDVAERFAALTVATAHYERLRIDGEDYAREVGGVDRERDEALAACLEYAHIRRALPAKKLPVPVGVCPWWKTGLKGVLQAEGGDEMVTAAFRAGVLVPKKDDDHYELFRGRLIFPWIEPTTGQTVYIKGRAVPEIGDLTHTKKVLHLGLRTNPNDPDTQPHVPKPSVPFGATWADELYSGRPIIIQEAEIDALSAMMAKIPSVAIGGTAGLGGAAVAEYIDRRPALVLWDNDWAKAMRQSRDGKPKHVWATQVAIKTARRLAMDLDCEWNLVRRMDKAKDLNQVLIDRGIRGVEEEVGWAVQNQVGVNDSTPGHLLIEPPMPLPEVDPQQDLIELIELIPSLDELGRRDVPDGWRVRQGVLYKTKWDKSKNTEIDQPSGIDRTPLVTAHVIDVHTEMWNVEIETPLIGGGRKKILARRSVVGTKKGIVSLADEGLDVTGETSAWMVKWLDDYQRHNKKTIPIVRGSEQFGWHGDRDGSDLTFLLGDRSVGPMDIRYVGGDVKLMRSVRTQGTMSQWRGVPEILSHYPRALVILYAALAAPCIRFIDEVAGFCVEVVGSSGTGKSTATQAAASVIASSSHGYMRSGAAGDTVPGLEHTMAASSDCPVFVEDTHKYSPEDQARLAMMAANGEGKARSNRSGTTRLPTKQWRTVAIFTTESPVSATTTFVGDQARTITLRPPMEADASDHIRQLQQLSARNYGHAFIQWIAHLQSGGWVQMIHAYDAWHKRVREVASSDSVQKRWAKPWALIAAVAECSAPVLGVSRDHAGIVSAECDEWFDGRETPSQARHALETVIEWAATRVDEVTNDEIGKNRTGQKHVWIRIIGEDAAAEMNIPEGSIAFAGKRLRRELAREKISLEVVTPVWRKNKWLVSSSHQMRVGVGRVRCVVIDPRSVNLSFRKEDTEETVGWKGRR